MTDKTNYAEFVSMTEEEYNKLIAKYGKKLTDQMITKLDNFKGSRGKKYKIDYRAILSWVAECILSKHNLPFNYDIRHKSEQVQVIEELEKMKKPDAEELAKMKKITKLMFGGKDERS